MRKNKDTVTWMCTLEKEGESASIQQQPKCRKMRVLLVVRTNRGRRERTC